MDLCFVVDRSGSICDYDPDFDYATEFTCSNWFLIVEFIASLVANFTINPNATRIGFVTFGNTGNLSWGLNDYTDAPTLGYAIESQRYMYRKGETTATSNALDVMRNEVFAGDNRMKVEKKAVIITDGKPTEPSTILAAVNAVAANNIATYVVGVTNNIDMYTIQKLTTPVQTINQTYFFAANFNAINALKTKLLKDTINDQCSTTIVTSSSSLTSTSSSTTTTSTTTTPTTTTSTTTTSTTTTPTTTTPGVICTNAQLDLAFLIDQSGSICNEEYVHTCGNWTDILNFTRGVVERLNISPSGVRVGLITFGEQATSVWNLTAYTNVNSLISAIVGLTFKFSNGGTTNTPGALDLLRTGQFNSSVKNRPNANRVAIIITDGKPTDNNTKPTDPSVVQTAVNKVNQSGITTLAVGVTNSINNATLFQLAQNQSLNVFFASNFTLLDNNEQNDTLNSVLARLPFYCGSGISSPSTPSTPGLSTPTSTTPTPGVDCVGDLAFLVDGSGSICNNSNNSPIGCSNWTDIKTFVKSVVNELVIGPYAVRVGMIRFSSKDDIKLIWNLTQYTNKISLDSAIDNLIYTSGSTYTELALDLMRTQMFNATYDNRPNVTKVGIIVTDGKPTDNSTEREYPDTSPLVAIAMQKVNASGIVTLAVGVTNDINNDTLLQLAQNQTQNIFTVPYFTQLDPGTQSSITNAFIQQLYRDLNCSNVTPTVTP